jgi:hypothetical protein
MPTFVAYGSHKNPLFSQVPCTPFTYFAGVFEQTHPNAKVGQYDGNGHKKTTKYVFGCSYKFALAKAFRQAPF